MSNKTREKAKHIKAEIGTEKAEKVAKVIAHMSNNKSTPATIIEALMDKFDLDTEQAGACWYAWQIYLL